MNAQQSPVSVLVVGHDASMQRLVRTAFQQASAEVVGVPDAAAAIGVLPRKPSAAIVDIDVPNGDGLAAVRQLRAADRRIPIVVLSASCDFESKIAVLRAGASACHKKTDDWRALTAHVLMLIQARSGARILVMEDDAVSAAIMSETLRNGGYAPRVCSDGGQFEAALLENPPDLILMDVCLPHVDGTELTRFLRQDERFETIPVIYITSMKNVEYAGEQVLRKPVAPDVLLAAVDSRLEQFLRLRALVERDALTGVLTRRAFLERAAAVIASSSPQARRRFCIAMIDIDHFKTVNDRYGHAAGDRVLVSLGETLHRSLRATDFVGRYGGEEFVVLLEDVDEHGAAVVLERILAKFRVIEHHMTRVTTISGTFSAGVTAIHIGEDDVTAAIARADLALYRAKRAGRNRVLASDRRPSEERLASAVNPETVAELRRLGVSSGHDMLREAVELFLALAPERIDVIKRALDWRDGDLLRREARALRDAAGNSGLTEVVTACERLEAIAEQQEFDGSGSALEHLMDAYTVGRDALARYIGPVVPSSRGEPA